MIIINESQMVMLIFQHRLLGFDGIWMWEGNKCKAADMNFSTETDSSNVKRMALFMDYIDCLTATNYEYNDTCWIKL